MKIIPVHQHPKYGQRNVTSGVVNAMTSTRDCLHYTFSDKTAVGKFAAKHPRISVTASLILLTGLIFGAVSLFKSDSNRALQPAANEVVNVTDAFAD